MKIEEMYRSTKKPDPLWTECALYCGYTHIAISQDRWVSRTAEYLVRELLQKPQDEKLKSELMSRSIWYYPSLYESSNHLKLLKILHKAKEFSVIGFSSALEQLLQSSYYTTIYTDSAYRLNHLKEIDKHTLAVESSHRLTLIHENCTYLKPDICNWGNVIVFSDEMCREDVPINYLAEERDYASTNKEQ